MLFKFTAEKKIMSHRYRRCVNAALKGLFLFCTLLVLAHISASGQQHRSRLTARVNYSAPKVTASVLLDALQSQTGHSFLFDRAALCKVSLEGIRFANITLGEALDVLEKEFGFLFSIGASNIAVKMKAGFPQQGGATAGKGALKGRVVDFETSQPLPGATVQLDGTTLGGVTDEKGFYVLQNVPAGEYTLVSTYVGYQRTVIASVKVESGRTAGYDVKMAAGGSLKEVVIGPGNRRIRAVTHSTDRQLLEEIRLARAVVSGISNEQIVKSADRNAAEVAQRIAGVTITDERFIVVRGMNQRYNVTYLNDNLAPSTEQYSRAFAFDLVPTRIIDRILIYKSPRPDIIGDFAGGATRIFTKDALRVRHIDFNFQTGYRPGSTFEKMLSYKGGRYDFLGFDDGSRRLSKNLPAFGDLSNPVISQQTYISSFSPVLSIGRKTAIPELNMTLNYYDHFKLGKARLSNITSLNYTYNAVNRDIYRQTGNTSLGGIDVAHDNNISYQQQSIENAQFSLLENLNLTLADSTVFRFRNFLLQQGQNVTAERVSHPNAVSANGYPEITKNNILSFSQRFLYAGNLGASHFFSKKNVLNWNLGLSLSRQSIPDQRTINFRGSTSTNPDWNPQYQDSALAWTAYGTSDDQNVQRWQQGIISRVYIRNNEQVYNFSADHTLQLKQGAFLQVGTYQQWKQREVSRRYYSVNNGDLTGDLNVDISTPSGSGGYIDLEKIRFREQDLPGVWSDHYFPEDGTGLKVYDRTNPTDSYIASTQHNAFYLALNSGSMLGKVELYGGARVEYDRLKLAAAIGTGEGVDLPVMIDRPKWSFLPSVNATYSINKRMVLRGAYGRTVNRPEFREVTPYNDLDFINNESVYGNPNLVSAGIDNADLRFELYPQKALRNELFNAGIFYKRLRNPIERVRYETVVRNGTVNFPQITYQNADVANVYGVEMELRKSLSFIPAKLFRNLSFIFNGTFIKSEARKDSVRTSDQAAFARKYKRQLQGQAPYVINSGLFYENPALGMKVSVTYNRSGASIYAVGNPEASITEDVRGSFIQLPRDLLDLAVTQRLFSSFLLKLSVQNLLNAPVCIAEDADGDYQYTKEYLTTGPNTKAYKGDNIYQRYYTRPYYQLAFTYSF